MTVQSAQSITVLFTTRVFATGVGTNADSLPTGTLYVNGTSNAATVTVTNVTTGLYKAQVTLPTLAVGDEVEIIISAIVSAIADKAVIWGDTKDILVDGSGSITFNNTSLATVTTVTTATNLTNAPTAGDFTAAMKTSLSAATPAVTVTTNNDKTGYALSSAGIDAILDQTAGIETNRTLRQGLRLMLASMAGKLSGAATTSILIRDTNDSKNRITATVDSSGNRSTVTYDAS